MPRLEKNSLKTNYLSYKIYFRDITLVDFVLLNSSLIKTNMNIYFAHVRYVKWFKIIEKNKINFSIKNL